jgi:Holliday junction resolvase
MSEQQIQSSIAKYLEKEGHYVVKVMAASKAGVPDLLVCIKGSFVAIEVKRPETRANTSELQKWNLNKITECGGISMVACSVQDVKDELCK